MIVYLDIDGVLADFRRGVCEEFNRKPDPEDGWLFWENWHGVTTKDVDAVCDRTFWLNLYWTKDGWDIYTAIRSKFDNIYLLTTPMPNDESWTGKAQWVEIWLPELYRRLIVTPAPKHLLAKPDTLLIDDKDENIAEFIAAGGHGILVPRPWNKLRGWTNESLQVVKNSLEELA